MTPLRPAGAAAMRSGLVFSGITAATFANAPKPCPGCDADVEQGSREGKGRTDPRYRPRVAFTTIA